MRPASTVEEMIRALTDFRGVRRRLELRGKTRRRVVFDDFAHHPTAILETLRAVRWSYPDRRIWAIFEPRSATSCRRVFQHDFARAFEESGADEIILASVFRSTLPEAERLSVDELVRHLNAARAARPAHRHRAGDRERSSRPRPGRATWSSSCRTAASTASTTSCWMRLGASLKRVQMNIEAPSRDRHAARCCRRRRRSRRRRPLAPFTTFRVGGPADWLRDRRNSATSCRR